MHLVIAWVKHSEVSLKCFYNRCNLAVTQFFYLFIPFWYNKGVTQLHLSTNDNALTRYVDLQHRNGTYRVGDFMTKKEHLHVVKPTTPVDEGIIGTWILFVVNILFLVLFLIYPSFLADSIRSSCGEKNYWLSCDWWRLEIGNFI